MTPGARIAAAIEVIADIEARRRPAADALKDWGLAHRFAGSGDRAAIAGLIYDTLRRRASSAYIMGDDTPRAIVLGMLRLERGLDAAAIARLADGVRLRAGAARRGRACTRLEAADLAGAPPWVAGDYPEWLDPSSRPRVRRRAGRGRRGARAPRTARPARQHAQGATVNSAPAELADLMPVPTPLVARSGCASSLRARRQGAGRSMPSRLSSRA